MSKEAKARIKINQLLLEAGWRFLPENGYPANVLLEGKTDITSHEFNDLGEDFENTKKGYIDYLLLDNNNFPLAVLEAKRESIHPLNAKRQAKQYAESQNARFVILSNGNLHYLWDITKGSPQVITRFPSPDSLGAYKEFTPDKDELINEPVGQDYIALTQLPDYDKHPEWKGVDNSSILIDRYKLRFLREYQVEAIKSIQDAVSKGKERFLFEMATGTGKTLTSAAIIKLFLRTNNARRVLFLVDRLELEDQAWKNFVDYLKSDYTTYIFKEKQDLWNKAEIVVSTIQSLMVNDKYKDLFTPTDFDLLISDEAHRSIGGNSRAVFEYFHGYKLGLTATPKDYLKGVDTDAENLSTPKELEIRMLKDTYVTFGCDDGNPTYRYSLLDGVKDNFLINPVTIDARTEITTQLLSDKGLVVMDHDDEGNEQEKVYLQKDFEKKFFSEKTNTTFCKSFLENALRDPVSGEIGKTIIFCVSQNHATKITQILNEQAEKLFAGKYNSDFAEQVTSYVKDSQQMTINFANNKLNGYSKFLEGYKTSKTRVCVTVGMMSTGYDCPDILNLCMMRPIFSPSDFVQIKGRGTRKHLFVYKTKNALHEEEIVAKDKKAFKLFDFFANCEYFEEKFNYDEKLVVRVPTGREGGGGPKSKPTTYKTQDEDPLVNIKEQKIGLEGMRIDRELFKNFENRVRSDDYIKQNIEAGNWDQIIHYIKQEIFDKPEEYFNLDKLRKAEKIDRKLSIREVVEKIFGIIPKFKSKDELLEEEFQKFVSIYPPEEDINVRALKYFFKAYVLDQSFRNILETGNFQDLFHNPSITIEEFKAVDPKYRKLVPQYVKSYVHTDKFAA